MRFIISQLAALIAGLLVVDMVIFPSPSFGQGNMQIVQGILPLNYTQQNVNDFVYAMENGLSSYGSWTSIPNASAVNMSNVFNFNGGSSGNAMFYGLFYTNSIPFTLASIRFSLSDKFGIISNTVGDVGVSFTLEGVGINGSTVYTSGNLTTPVTAIYILGAGYTIDNGSSSIQQGLAIWAPYSPIDETVTYYAGGIQQSAYTIYIVPPPPTPTINHISNSIIVSWPNTGIYTLLLNSNLVSGTWVTNGYSITTANGTNSITITPPPGYLFFRLKQ